MFFVASEISNSQLVYNNNKLFPILCRLDSNEFSKLCDEKIIIIKERFFKNNAIFFFEFAKIGSLIPYQKFEKLSLQYWSNCDVGRRWKVALAALVENRIVRHR